MISRSRQCKCKCRAERLLPGLQRLVQRVHVLPHHGVHNLILERGRALQSAQPLPGRARGGAWQRRTWLPAADHRKRYLSFAASLLFNHTIWTTLIKLPDFSPLPHFVFHQICIGALFHKLLIKKIICFFINFHALME